MKVLTIARNTFREAVRDKVFGLVGAFGVLLVVSSLILSPLTVGAQTKMVADVGLGSIPLFALLIILLLGSGMVHKEIDKRTIMTLLAKPLTRTDYVLGKYLGLMATLLVIMSCMAALFAVSVWLAPGSFAGAYGKALFLSLCEMTVVTAVALFFSAFAGPVLTSLFTLGAYLVGHTLGDLESFARLADRPAAEAVLGVVRWILPNLDLYNVRNAAVHGLPIEPAHVLFAALYALLYAGLCLTAASWVLGRREFK
jgi:ABC-type transport system involved in multi-copper enzyme maturation permease subunit